MLKNINQGDKCISALRAAIGKFLFRLSVFSTVDELRGQDYLSPIALLVTLQKAMLSSRKLFTEIIYLFSPILSLA